MLTWEFLPQSAERMCGEFVMGGFYWWPVNKIQIGKVATNGLQVDSLGFYSRFYILTFLNKIYTFLLFLIAFRAVNSAHRMKEGHDYIYIQIIQKNIHRTEAGAGV